MTADLERVSADLAAAYPLTIDQALEMLRRCRVMPAIAVRLSLRARLRRWRRRMFRRYRGALA